MKVGKALFRRFSELCLDKFRAKRLKYLASKRGTLENELIFDKFWTKNASAMTATDWDLFEQFLNEYDGDIFTWVTGKREVPECYKNSKMLELLKNTLK